MTQALLPESQRPLLRNNAPLPLFLTIYLLYLGLGLISVLALAGLTLMIQDILWEVPVIFGPLAAAQAVIWAFYFIPGSLALAYSLQHSPKARFYLKLTAWSALAITFLAGLAISAGGPAFIEGLSAFLKELYPELSILKAQPDKVIGQLTTAVHFLFGLAVSINGAWLLYLTGSEKIKDFFPKTPEPSSPQVTSLASAGQSSAKNIPGLMPGLMGVFFILLIFRGFNSIVGTTALFFFHNGLAGSYSNSSDFVSLFFRHYSFFLALSLVPPVAAAFGLGSLKREKEHCRSALLISLLAIIFFAVYSLTYNLINLRPLFEGDLSNSIFVLSLTVPFFYAAGAIFFIIVILRRREKARQALADHGW